MIAIVTGYVADLLFGDPSWLPHPVRIIGLGISKFEGILRNKELSPKEEKFRGMILTSLLVGITYLITTGIVRVASGMNETIGFLIEAFLIFQMFATKSLDVESRRVLNQLENGNLEEARRFLSYIVGRDTTALSEQEVVRGTVETVAENISDGIIAPMLFTFIGGIPLGMAYKAVNTLDSMVGYKNDKYINFGWASAKSDDLANYIPARITGVLIIIAAFLCGLNWRNAWIILKRDRRNHSSPNSGYCEAAVAGALGIQIGGTNTYFGKAVYKPTIGDPVMGLYKNNIAQTIAIMYTTSFICLIILCILFSITR